MGDEKKDKGVEDPIKMLLEEALEKKRNMMMDNFAQILQQLPTGSASASSIHSGGETHFKVQHYYISTKNPMAILSDFRHFRVACTTL